MDNSEVVSKLSILEAWLHEMGKHDHDRVFTMLKEFYSGSRQRDYRVEIAIISFGHVMLDVVDHPDKIQIYVWLKARMSQDLNV